MHVTTPLPRHRKLLLLPTMPLVMLFSMLIPPGVIVTSGLSSLDSRLVPSKLQGGVLLRKSRLRANSGRTPVNRPKAVRDQTVAHMVRKREAFLSMSSK